VQPLRCLEIGHLMTILFVHVSRVDIVYTLVHSSLVCSKV